MALRPTTDPEGALIAEGAKLRVLFVAATPPDLASLALGEEYRQIDAAVRAAEAAARFEFHFVHEVRADELGPALLRVRPHVVHFSGHGDQGGELLLSDATGNATRASLEKVAGLFAAVAGELPIRCVVLNACYSAPLAEALATHVDCVIGVPVALADGVAVAFGAAFYQAIGFGCDLAAAYAYARAQVGLVVPQHDTLPTPHARPGLRLEKVRLLSMSRADASAARAMTVAPDDRVVAGGAREDGRRGRPLRFAGIVAVAVTLLVAAVWKASDSPSLVGQTEAPRVREPDRPSSPAPRTPTHDLVGAEAGQIEQGKLPPRGARRRSDAMRAL